MSELNKERIINTLEEELKYVIELQHRLECYDEDTPGLDKNITMIHSALALIKELTEENERLKSELGKEFTCFVGDPHKVEHCPYLEEMERIKADTVRKMQERLEKKVSLLYRQSNYVTTEDIDQVAKELLEE